MISLQSAVLSTIFIAQRSIRIQESSVGPTVSDNETVEFEEFDDLEGETELTPPELYAANLIDWAVDRHASDLFMSDTGQ